MQHATIEFYKAIAGKNFYLETAGFKSYAYLFYTNKKPEQNQNPDCIKYVNETLDRMESQGHNRLTSYALAYTNWMQYGNIDKPAVFVCKINTARNGVGRGVFLTIHLCLPKMGRFYPEEISMRNLWPLRQISLRWQLLKWDRLRNGALQR